MKRGNAFESKYLGKEELLQPVRSTIANVYQKQIDGENNQKETKCVLSFGDAGIKPLIVNLTNWTTLEAMYGEESDNWRGKPIEVYVDPSVMYGKKMVGGVRVRAIPAGTAPAPAPAPPVDLIQLPEALDAVGADTLRDAIKAKGFTGYNAERDTAMVRQLIDASPQAEASSDPDDIPF